MPNNLPDWYTPEQPATPVAQQPVQGAAPAAMPSWYTPEPVAAAEPQAHPYLDAAKDAAATVATGVAKAPGVVIGTPHFIGHTANWAKAQLFNGLDAVTGGKGEHTGAEMDAQDPVMQVLPSAEGVDKALFKGASLAAGRDVTPYEPTSVLGKLFQAGVTGAATGGRSIPGAVKNAVAAMAANGTQQAFPDSPGLAALAALVAHAGASGAGKVAVNGLETFVKPNVSAFGIADRAGQRAAARNITEAGPNPGALNNPSDLKLAADKKAVADITQPWGAGTADHQAGETLREGLQGRADTLTAHRGATADAAYDLFRAEQPLEGAKLGQFMGAPAFRSAVKEASEGSLNRLEKPLTDFLDFNVAGDPVFKPNAAVPPDVLQRIKGALDDQISSASARNVHRGDLTDLRTKFVALLDKEYPGTYPKTRAEFAANSRPLDDLTEGKVGKVLDSEKKFGRSPQYTMDAERITDKYLTSNGTTSDYAQLHRAFGGEAGPTTALKALRENLIHKVQDAIAPDGTLSPAAFDKAIGPYRHNLQVRFPGLAKEFADAKTAQATMDRGVAQRSLTDAVEGGALRTDGAEGVVTRTSALQWMAKNKTKLTETHTPAELHRLRGLANSLPEGIGAGADAAVEAVPMFVGAAAGGMEGGVLGGIIHKTPAFLAGPGKAKFRAGYNAAVEKAFTDPAEGARLSALAAKQRGMTGQQALLSAIKQSVKGAVLATPMATLAGTPSR